MKGSIYQRGRTWSWQFTSGSRVNGTRRHHSKGGYATREECETALALALAKAAEDTIERIAPFVIDNSAATLCDLIDSGACSAPCVFALIEEHLCTCRCGGDYHGLAREGHSSAPDPRALLRGLRSELATRSDREAAAMQSARASGMGWAEIGELAGLNPEHLSRKYGATCPRREPGERRSALAEASEAYRRGTQ